MKGCVEGKERVPVRVHSECLFGDVLGSRRCDCGPQLRSFLEDVLRDDGHPCGLLLYVRGHEGKGIGLENKLRAYELQDSDNVTEAEANLRLGFRPDVRRYGGVRAALRHLGVRSITLYTDNERKVMSLGSVVGATVPWDRARRRWKQLPDRP